MFLNNLLSRFQAGLSNQLAINNRINQLKDSLGVDENSDTTIEFGKLNNIVSNTDQFAKFQKELDSLIKLNKELVLLSDTSTPISKYSQTIEDEITDFELKNMPSFTGYSISWQNIKGSFGNTRNKLYNDTLNLDSLITFKLSDYARFRFSFDANWMRNTTKALNFLKLEAALFNRNFLQNIKMSDLPYIEKDPSGKKYVYTSDKSKPDGRLGTLEDLNRNIWVVNPNIYAASFLLFDKCIGFEFSGGYKFNLNKLQDIPDPNTYTVYGGLIFRVKKDEEFSKATISVNAGFYDEKKEDVPETILLFA